MIALLQGETTVVVQEAASGGIGLSELLSGFIGALIVFGLQFILGQWRRRRERIALMTVMHLEIMHNERTIDELHENMTSQGISDPLATGEIVLLRDDAWKENRARITQLEARRALEYLGMYYTSVETLLAAGRLMREADGDLPDVDVEEMFVALRNNLGPRARYACERQTRVVRGWSYGMLVVAPKGFQPSKSVEANWYQRVPRGRSEGESSEDEQPPEDST